ncbi:MAG: hemerythrin domain-containing protein [Syntrophomonadaceae bacterium]
MAGTIGQTRRGLLGRVAAGLVGWEAHGNRLLAETPDEKKGDEVSPPEDLMREHGVLKRVMMIYDEILRRLGGGGAVAPEPLADAARVIRQFVEDYHEKLEEDHLFPRFEKAHRLTELVTVLREQHQAGRRLTDVVLAGVAPVSWKDGSTRDRVAAALRAFNRMYGPHEAREDTVLFPAMRRVVSPHEFDALGEEFERRENQLFGEDGFEKMVDRVAGIEKRLGIEELAQFTPKA